ncbi:MAG: PAS and helix-turn-helix domain-containing protein [Bacteroidota bacterium]|jgi:DNA-binding CsgD family transcriptional regulator
MSNNGNNNNSRFTTRDKYEECYNLTFLQSDMGVWLAQFHEPMPINLPIDQQVEHLLKHAYLSDCNYAFVKMYGYDLPKDMIGMSFTQLFDNGEVSNLNNLHEFLKNGYKVRNKETIEIGKNVIRKHFLNDIIGIVEDNHLVRVWGVQRDITTEKAIEEENKKILQQLTPQELTILKLTVDGKSLKEIGDTIGVNHKTVDSLRAKIRTKLNVSSLAQLMFLAYKLGFPDIDL